MAKNSQIEWTDHTFNPWWGCAKVSPACDNCYAELWAKRVGQQIWGVGAPRRLFNDAHWREPLLWNEEARLSGRHARVFCASMADVFERRVELDDQRARLWALIERTPWLDWLLLTKRPQNVGSLAPWTDRWPANVWLGSSVENQTLAERRLPLLLKHPAAVRFLSCEPLLGPLDLREWFRKKGLHPIDWIIAGGESGPNSRPMHPDWAAGLLHQCQEAEVPFHFKQWGHWAPAELLVQVEKPTLIEFGGVRPVKMVRVGKKLAGRILEGTTWDGVPGPSLVHAQS
jgi:protein gp37